jgi:predicted  nucleic acid-binding Zn-ribbon protein
MVVRVGLEEREVTETKGAQRNMRKTPHKNARKDCTDAIEAFVKVFESTKSTYNYLTSQQPSIEGEIQDLLHEVEFGEQKGRTDAARMYRELRRLRIERRRVQNELEAMEPILKWFRAHADTRNELTQLLGQARRTLVAQENRIYCPRSRPTNPPVSG